MTSKLDNINLCPLSYVNIRYFYFYTHTILSTSFIFLLLITMSALSLRSLSNKFLYFIKYLICLIFFILYKIASFPNFE